jgi:hypothetical protein
MNKGALDNQAAEMIQFDRLMLGIHTAIPGVIVSFDAETRLAKVKPAIAMKVISLGEVKYINLPIIENVPVCLPHSRSAGLYITVPVKANDECLLIFSQRAIDNFVLFGGIQTPPANDSLSTTSPRHHDLTDAICIPGIITMTQALTGWNQDAIEIRNGAGTSKLSVYTDKIDANTATVNIVAGDINITGHVEVTGDIHSSGDIVANTISLMNHIHSGVMSGPSNTGVPVP